MPEIVCNIPQEVVTAFVGTSATTVTLPQGGSVTVEISYTTDDAWSECTQFMGLSVQKTGDEPVSFVVETEAEEDTIYEYEWEPTERGTYTLKGYITWSHTNPPTDSATLWGNAVTVVAWADNASADGELPERSATAGAEDRSGDAEVETRNATAGMPERSADASAESRSATAGLRAKGATSVLETRTATAGLRTISADAGTATRAATAGLVSRSVNAELPVRTIAVGVKP